MRTAPECAGSFAIEHPAMNTVFTIRLRCEDASANDRSAAGACFGELDRLEALLSRYRADSDVSRINDLSAGESLYIHEDTHAVLRAALDLQDLTGGLFDVTLGRHTLARQRNPEQSGDAVSPPSGQLAIDPERPKVTCIQPGRQIDLGGIGKGFALDRMAAILHHHGIDESLLQAGGSTLLAFGENAWNIRLGLADAAREIPLQAAALSVSGVGIQGNHILLPDGRTPPTYAWNRLWVVAQTAAAADALSTACLLMDARRLRDFAAETSAIEAIWSDEGESIRCYKPSPDTKLQIQPPSIPARKPFR